ncbi:MAG: hypothetical protein ABII22_01475 [Candidatus Micrarchaeota archaeon]
MKYAKGQIWSTDLLIASLVMLAIFFIFVISWNNLGYNWNSSQIQNKIYFAALFASDALIAQDSGNWENEETLENATSFGIVGERNELDNKKLSRLASANYTVVKEKLGIEGYGLFINITNGSGTFYVFGVKPTNYDQTVVVERLAILNGSVVKVKVNVWQ